MYRLNIKDNKDYYCLGADMYTSNSIRFDPGISVLVGCNGIGKSTLLNMIKYDLGTKKKGIACKYSHDLIHSKKTTYCYRSFDNLFDGGHNAKEEAAALGNMKELALRMSSSEGEQIYYNFGNIIQKVGHDIHAMSSFADLKKYVLLFDAVDSGLSIDNIIEIKDVFKSLIIPDFYKTMNDENAEIFVIFVANEYEMANGEDCISVYDGKHIKFKDYNEYRDYVLESRKFKDSRIKEENKRKKGGSM